MLTRSFSLSRRPVEPLLHLHCACRSNCGAQPSSNKQTDKQCRCAGVQHSKMQLTSSIAKPMLIRSISLSPTVIQSQSGHLCISLQPQDSKRNTHLTRRQMERLRAIGLILMQFMAIPAVMPKDQRGLRCTMPFCDFSCCAAENCTWGDMGGDWDITVEMVRFCMA